MPRKSAANKTASTRTKVVKTASVSSTAKNMSASKRTAANVTSVESQSTSPSALTEKETRARMARKYATTTFGFNTRKAFDGGGYGDVSSSSYGNFYSPQLSTDFLEKPQNLRERRAWYRHFYNSNEFVGAAIDLHSTLPLSKIRLEKPKTKNQDTADYVYDFFVDMCDDMKLFKSLLEISHEYWLLGNCFIYAEDHDPYEVTGKGDLTSEDIVNELKEMGKIKSDKLYKKFEITDKDPNYLGWRKLLVLPPDQVRIKKVPLSDDSLIEFIPDPETKKNVLQARQGFYPGEYFQAERNPYKVPQIPDKLVDQLEENGTIPLDTDPYTGSHVYHLARKKSQYETLGVSILERCVNTLLLQDKLRQAQTSIASRHMTPIRIVWGEDLSEPDVENLREQVDLALVDPDFSIITNYQVNWEEMGSNGRLLELSGEYDHIENSLFAGLNVTREILTGEGTYTGSRITLEIMNTQYLLYRELLQEYVENSLFKPVARKKGFVEVDKYGREKLIYPKLSFTRLAIRDNDAFFDQAMQLYNKGSISIDVILDMLNIDPESTSKKIKADLFTVDDFAFNQLMSNVYTAAGQTMVERYNVADKLAEYMDLQELEQPPVEGEAGAGMGGDAGMPRFAKTAKSKKKENPKVAAMPSNKKAALQKMLNTALANPDKLEKIMSFLEKNQ
jgi:hypothetical protein